MQNARAVAHGPDRPAFREKRSSDGRVFGDASSNSRVDRNLRTTFRGSHPWNQAEPWLHRRLKRQYILHLFAPCDVVACRIRVFGCLCYLIFLMIKLAWCSNGRIVSTCDATSKVVGLHPLSSLRHGARTVFQFVVLTVVVSSPDSCTLSWSSNIWSCPSVLQLVTMPNTWAMTADLCGYGDKWRKRPGLLMGWIDSRDQHRFAKHGFKNKWQLFLLVFKALFALPTHIVSAYSALFVDASAVVLSTREQPSSSLTWESGLGDVVWRAVYSRSLELHVTIVDSCGCLQHDTFTVSLQLHIVR